MLQKIKAGNYSEKAEAEAKEQPSKVKKVTGMPPTMYYHSLKVHGQGRRARMREDQVSPDGDEEAKRQEEEEEEDGEEDKGATTAGKGQRDVKGLNKKKMKKEAKAKEANKPKTSIQDKQQQQQQQPKEDAKKMNALLHALWTSNE